MGKNTKKNPDGRLEYIGTMRFHSGGVLKDLFVFPV